MQPLAMYALASGVVMILGVSAALVLARRGLLSSRRGISRWQRHGSIPLAAAGLAIATISRSSGQSPATHDIVSAEAVTLLLAALLCALAGAVVATRQRPGGDQA